MSKKDVMYNDDVMYKVQKWPYLAAKDLTSDELMEWYDKEGYKGKTFIFQKINEYYKGRRSYDMGYAIAWGLGGYIATALLLGFLGLWVIVKILSVFSH